MVWLWYVFIGLVIYLAHFTFRKMKDLPRLCAYVASGLLAAGPAWRFGAARAASTFRMPGWMVLVAGGAAGAVLFWSEHKEWNRRFWLRFFLTPILGGGIGLFLFFCYTFVDRHTVSTRSVPVLFTFMLMGLLAVFGYTFPERWFAVKK